MPVPISRRNDSAAPCPFCNATTVYIREHKAPQAPSGAQGPSHVILQHECAKTPGDGIASCKIEIRDTTQEKVLAAWDARSVSQPAPDSPERSKRRKETNSG